MFYLKLILTLSICVSAFLGDYIVFNSKYSSSRLFRALSDSLVHAVIGLISSMMFFSHDITNSKYIYFINVGFCTAVSSFIDIDHFFVAKSIHFKDLRGLKHRGIFHCASFWLLLSAVLLIYSYTHKRINAYLLSWMFLIAGTSHQIRDANRRGLWFYPIGHTPAFSKFLYVVLISTLPHIFAYCYIYTKAMIRNLVEIDYKLIV